MNQVNRLTSKIDILGPKFSFYIGKNRLKTLKSVFGGILSLFFILFMITAIYVFGRKWLKKTHPVVSVNSYFSKRDHIYDLYKSRIFIAFAMFDGTKYPKTEETGKFFTLKAQYETVFAGGTNESERRTMIDPIPVKDCQHLVNNHSDFTDQALSQDDAEFFRGSVLCTDKLGSTNSKIRGAPFELPYSIIHYRIYPCSLEDPRGCATPSELAQSLIIIPIISKSASFNNFSQPLKDGIDADLTSKFSLATKTQLSIWFRESSIYDDNADFIKSLEARTTYLEQHKVTSTIGTRDGSFHCTSLQIEDGECQPYIEILVRASPSSTMVERRYYKLMNAVSEVGGFGELVFLIMALISSWFNTCYQTRWVRKQLYQGLIELQKEKGRPETTLNGDKLNQKLKRERRVAENSKRAEKLKKDDLSLIEEEYPELQDRSMIPSTSRRRLHVKTSEISESIQQKKKVQQISEKGIKNGLEELRVEFDHFELLDASKKCHILSTIFIKDFHKVLLPRVIYQKRENQKNTKTQQEVFPLRVKSKDPKGSNNGEFDQKGRLSQKGGSQEREMELQRSILNTDDFSGSDRILDVKRKIKDLGISSFITKTLLQRLNQIKNKQKNETQQASNATKNARERKGSSNRPLCPETQQKGDRCQKNPNNRSRSIIITKSKRKEKKDSQLRTKKILNSAEKHQKQFQSSNQAEHPKDKRRNSLGEGLLQKRKLGLKRPERRRKSKRVRMKFKLAARKLKTTKKSKIYPKIETGENGLNFNTYPKKGKRKMNRRQKLKKGQNISSRDECEDQKSGRYSGFSKYDRSTKNLLDDIPELD